MSTTETTEKLARFIERVRVRMDDPEWVDRNPNLDDDEWSRGAHHFKLTLHCDRRRMTTYFSQGSAIEQEPTIADLLDCLASDAAGIENARSFEDWCSEYGYNTDSQKAERTYTVVQRQSDKLRTLLGDDEYDALLWRTELE